MIRFLHPEIAWWLLAALAGVILVKWLVRWRYAARRGGELAEEARAGVDG